MDDRSFAVMVILEILRTPTNTTFDVSILSLPTELIHIICTNLEPPDVADFRLLHSSVAAVGVEY